jgi:photosystem II stability/assembly factor-like uncharacterized protein
VTPNATTTGTSYDADSVSKASRRSSRHSRPITTRRGRPIQPRRPWRPLALAAGVVAVVAVAVVAFIGLKGSNGSAAPWSRLGTEDVHSLAFVDDDPNRLLFGHHGGISASDDGGRSWQSLGTRSDAMSLGAASDGSIVIAGHEVFASSRDDGRTWENIPAALPSLDIHGFARDPGDPARMWAYLATGGLWESLDGGITWEGVQQENVLFPVAVRASGATRLFGVTANGLASSDDGGRTWRSVATPEIYPLASLVATTDGSVLVAGGQGGLARSDDGGATWSELPFDGQAAAIAVTAGGATIGIVTRSTDFFRSDDGGRTWPAP